MDFRVLAVGDVVGTPGLDCLRKHLPKLRRQYEINFCVVNGENAAMAGMTVSQGETIFDAGADVITLGNHTWNQREICTYLDDNSRVLRPANFAPQLPGSGVGVYDTDRGRIAVVNLVGRCGMDFNPDNPFTRVDQILKKLEGKKVTIQRSKGLGENDPEMMWMTTMNPETRRLIKVMPEDVERTAYYFDILLGDNLAQRKNFIAENGAKYLELADIS